MRRWRDDAASEVLGFGLMLGTAVGVVIGLLAGRIL